MNFKQIALFSLLLGLMSCQKEQKALPDSSPKPFSALDWKSQTKWSSTKADSSATLYVFWATWCSACQQELPDLMRLQAETDPQKLRLVSVNLDENPAEALPRYLKSKNFPFPILLPSAEMQQSIGIPSSMPTLLLVDSKGQIMQKWVGAQPYTLLRQEIFGLLNLQ